MTDVVANDFGCGSDVDAVMMFAVVRGDVPKSSVSYRRTAGKSIVPPSGSGIAGDISVRGVGRTPEATTSPGVAGSAGR
jgi:hypothetical protein